MALYETGSKAKQMDEKCLKLLHKLMTLKSDYKKEAIQYKVQDCAFKSMCKFVDSLEIQKYGSLILGECLKGLSNDNLKQYDLKISGKICLAFDMSQEMFKKLSRNKDKEYKNLVLNCTKDIGRAMLHMYLQLLQVLPTTARLGQIADSITPTRICNCMLKFPDDLLLQHDGIWCLEYLTPIKREEITSANGLKAICTAMKR